MLIVVSYINLCVLLGVSICQIGLAIIYHGQCPASSFLLTILIMTGAVGVCLSIIALLIHRFDVYDGSNKWNLLVTYILFIYLIGSRIGTSIMVFRLSSRLHGQYHCAPVFYWTSTVLIIVSYSVIAMTGCILINLICLQRRHNEDKKPIDPIYFNI